MTLRTSLVAQMSQGCPLLLNLVNMTFKQAQIIAYNLACTLKPVCHTWPWIRPGLYSTPSLQCSLPMICHEKDI